MDVRFWASVSFEGKDIATEHEEGWEFVVSSKKDSGGRNHKNSDFIVLSFYSVYLIYTKVSLQ